MLLIPSGSSVTLVTFSDCRVAALESCQEVGLNPLPPFFNAWTELGGKSSLALCCATDRSVSQCFLAPDLSDKSNLRTEEGNK